MKQPPKTKSFNIALSGIVVILLFLLVGSIGFLDSEDGSYHNKSQAADPPPVPVLNKDAYNAKLLFLAHINVASTTTEVPSSASSTEALALKGLTLLQPATATTTVSAVHKLWPVATVYPNAGALLPFNRIVAYYGNFYSTGMGVLGEYPPNTMIQMLKGVVSQWQAADPSTPVIPALDYIAVVAQGSPGADGKYRARMPASQIEEAINLMAPLHGIVFLDVQAGLSPLSVELPLLEPYLKLPNVELSLDPEFYMVSTGAKPGSIIGTMDASDVNYAAGLLAQIVRANNLPPKILVVHRFTDEMVTHTSEIKPLPEVQVVIDMDGWGTQARKISTYTEAIYAQPVQFTGFKLFYKNDTKPPSTGMLSPQQILDLTPAPSYIQYQ